MGGAMAAGLGTAAELVAAPELPPIIATGGTGSACGIDSEDESRLCRDARTVESGVRVRGREAARSDRLDVIDAAELSPLFRDRRVVVSA